MVPPYTQAVFNLGPVAANSRSTCLASSLVGASTMHPGDLGLCVRAMSFSTTGRAKARVLPDPVLARPIRSRPVATSNAGKTSRLTVRTKCEFVSAGLALTIPANPITQILTSSVGKAECIDVVSTHNLLRLCPTNWQGCYSGCLWVQRLPI